MEMMMMMSSRKDLPCLLDHGVFPFHMSEIPSCTNTELTTTYLYTSHASKRSKVANCSWML